MARLLAVVAETLRRRAHLGIVANIATLVARTARKQHLVGILELSSSPNGTLTALQQSLRTTGKNRKYLGKFS
ncbi:hypothetical protein BDV38DRAFT_256867 [Aspergillus pseudotamarii]|uniref:Uncharacterized protein n=1 Tax=Aspergillus pseudotamarii TaxID=132259 RepID=A0A5N6SGX2_ASPPS|nr:uncharacterized protein BDV38DRAFT_256867 [Aspergillus pseudotamarii]KAE8133968.1 hypothetical protein BDV38DRAFT_256867 [Aspergillus pseudotamarii]